MSAKHAARATLEYISDRKGRKLSFVWLSTRSG